MRSELVVDVTPRDMTTALLEDGRLVSLQRETRRDGTAHDLQTLGQISGCALGAGNGGHAENQTGFSEQLKHMAPARAAIQKILAPAADRAHIDRRRGDQRVAVLHLPPQLGHAVLPVLRAEALQKAAFAADAGLHGQLAHGEDFKRRVRAAPTDHAAELVRYPQRRRLFFTARRKNKRQYFHIASLRVSSQLELITQKVLYHS